MTGHARGPVARLLPDGRRLHLQHGPIDLVIEGFGARDAVERAYAQAWERFQDVLGVLVGELALLRAPLGRLPPPLEGPVARRMLAACWPHRPRFVTPMAAVAGAVADEILEAMLRGVDLERAYVNDGGDVALHLSPGASFACGVVGDVSAPAIDGTVAVAADMPVRGLATSGWRGRSHSLGIADAVTVLARTAAAADVAATLIANAVNVAHPAVRRAPARDLDPDSDLGDRRVTVGIGPLPPHLVAEALDAGAAEARRMAGRGLIHGAVLLLAGQHRVVGPMPVDGLAWTKGKPSRREAVGWR